MGNISEVTRDVGVWDYYVVCVGWSMKQPVIKDSLRFIPLQQIVCARLQNYW